jgi:SAM-dependent methyltransferase
MSAQNGIFGEGDAYELFMGRWSRRLAPLLVRFAAVADGDVVLDVGCGTGELTLAIAAVGPAVDVTGIDPSSAYTDAAQSRAPSDRVRFLAGDAQALQFPDAAFDRTLSMLALNFVPDREAALREMIRVTRHRGIVAAAVWDYGGRMDMLRVFWDEAIALDPAIAVRDERHMALCREGELGELWRTSGLANVEDRPLDIELAFSSFDDYWRPFLGGQGPAGAYTASLSTARRDALAARLRHRLLGDRSDGPFLLQARAWAVRGVVPRC